MRESERSAHKLDWGLSAKGIEQVGKLVDQVFQLAQAGQPLFTASLGVELDNACRQSVNPPMQGDDRLKSRLRTAPIRAFGIEPCAKLALVAAQARFIAAPPLR